MGDSNFNCVGFILILKLVFTQKMPGHGEKYISEHDV